MSSHPSLLPSIPPMCCLVWICRSAGCSQRKRKERKRKNNKALKKTKRKIQKIVWKRNDVCLWQRHRRWLTFYPYRRIMGGAIDTKKKEMNRLQKKITECRWVVLVERLPPLDAAAVFGRDRMDLSNGGVLQLRQLFQACDRHQRGYIDRHEFGQLCASFQIDPADVDVIFNDLDRDRDQRIR